MSLYSSHLPFGLCADLLCLFDNSEVRMEQFSWLDFILFVKSSQQAVGYKRHDLETVLLSWTLFTSALFNYLQLSCH